jgi:hypothetical protein
MTKTKHKSKTAPREKGPTPRAQALNLMKLMGTSEIPDFLGNVVQQTVDHACDHVGYSRPLYEPGFENDDIHLLTNLCRKTRMLHITDLEASTASLARHIKAILEHPQCSGALRESLLEFITEVQNHRVYDKDSLANEWLTDQKVLERVIERAREYEEAPDDQRT